MAADVSKQDKDEPFQRSTRLKDELEPQLELELMGPSAVDEFENKTHLEPGSMGVNVGVKRGSSCQNYAEEEKEGHKAEAEKS